MRIAGLRPTSLFDGVGINYVIFVQGCAHHCPHCHNKSTWDFNAGKEISVEKLIKGIEKYLGFIDGVTFSGGDPMYQLEEVNEIAKWAKEHDLQTTLYTGFTLQEIVTKNYPLKYMDYIIDGPYDGKKNTTALPFRGSSNQIMWNQCKDGRFYECPTNILLDLKSEPA